MASFIYISVGHLLSSRKRKKEMVEKKHKGPAMKPDEFEQKMLEIKKKYYEEENDEEVCHAEMDDLICLLLRKLGYGKGVDIFCTTPKWYA